MVAANLALCLLDDFEVSVDSVRPCGSVESDEEVDFVDSGNIVAIITLS